MSSPVVPNDFKSLIISPTANFCLAFVKLVLQLPVKIYTHFNWAWDASGNVTNDFMRQFIRPGDLMFSATSADRTGFLLCNNQLVSKDTYPELYTAIGTQYNLTSDVDVNFFRVPDYRGRFPVGVGATQRLGADEDVTGHNYALGEIGGKESVVLTMANLPAQPPPLGTKADKMLVHRTANGQEVNTDRKALSDTSSDHVYRTNSEEDHDDNALGNLGTDTPHDNIPPYIGVYVWIKT